MKKNKFLRIASALLMLCLITTCAVSGTFAKYTTSDSDSDTARVAKWGVTIGVDGTLFGSKYDTNEATENKNSIVATSTNVASANGTDRIVAPGTKNDKGLKIALKGAPEVQYKLEASSITAATATEKHEIWLKANTYGIMVEVHGVNAYTDLGAIYEYDSGNSKYKLATFDDTPGSTKKYYELQNYVVCSGDGYYPITWSVAEAITTNEGANFTAAAPFDARLADIAADLVAQFNNKEIDANEGVDISYTLTWEWEYYVSAENDKLDTILGNIQAGDVTVVKLSATPNEYVLVETSDYNLDIDFNFTLTATQVD